MLGWRSRRRLTGLHLSSGRRKLSHATRGRESRGKRNPHVPECSRAPPKAREKGLPGVVYTLNTLLELAIRLVVMEKPPSDLVSSQLKKILASEGFARNERLRGFL